jgi:enamine deaminase RidA (YjgF/YER057c/UK114 family)
MTRINISSNTKWEPLVGYSRAVKSGPFISVSGTTATNEKGELIGYEINEPYQQTIQVIKNIEAALKQVGANLKDIIRTRIYVSNIDFWSEIGRAHAEYFSEIRPATSMIEVVRFIHPDILVEIEADAYLEN